MRIFLVGGAVRDELLGAPVTDRDYVVVGASAERLLSLGFRSVGKDFPVFLHPETGEEYALARTEKKTGPGYKGFAFDVSPEVTLESDLLRRDLTINAMARTDRGELIDPYGGVRDLRLRMLRHISPAFGEDPLRVLRVARFASVLSPYGFRVAPETLHLMEAMVHSGELDSLVPERVFLELKKALQSISPRPFIEVLRSCGGLKVLFPEIDALFESQRNSINGVETDLGLRTLEVLDTVTQASVSPVTRFAALVHDLGRAQLDFCQWSDDAEVVMRGAESLMAIARRLPLPKEFLRLAKKVIRFHADVHRVHLAEPEGLLTLLERMDLFRQEWELEAILQVCRADLQAGSGYATIEYPQAEILREALAVTKVICIEQIKSEGYDGPLDAQRVHAQRLRQLLASPGQRQRVR